MQVMQVIQVIQGIQGIQVIQVIDLYREGDRFYTGRFKLVESTNASGAIWWPNLQPMQVAPSGGQIWN